MRKGFVLSIFLVSLWGEDFINKFEYGEMLYKNPRGVSCEGCHGTKGEGKKLGRVQKQKREINITAPNISKATVEDVKKGLRIRKSVMPTYFLTDTEVDAIVYYVKKQNDNNRTK
jgi:mono/diheme cytochrome c family protein